MSDDLVKRLDGWANTLANEEAELVRAARDRIEALEKALRYFVTACDTAPPVQFIAHVGIACEKARAALEAK